MTWKFEGREKKLLSREKKRKHKIHNKGMMQRYTDRVKKEKQEENPLKNPEYVIAYNPNSYVPEMRKEVGMAGDVSTPTFDGGEKKEIDFYNIKNKISKLIKSADSLEDEAKENEPKTPLQRKILQTVEHLEKELSNEQLIQKFLNEYQKLALLSNSFDSKELNNLFEKSLEIWKFKDTFPDEYNLGDKIISKSLDGKFEVK